MSTLHSRCHFNLGADIALIDEKHSILFTLSLSLSSFAAKTGCAGSVPVLGVPDQPGSTKPAPG
jgi:hypothetical protein